MTKPIKLTALQGAEVLPVKKECNLECYPGGFGWNQVHEGHNRCLDELSQVGVGIDEDTLAYELEKRIADEFSAELPQYFKDMAKVLASTASQWLRLERIK